MIGGKLSLIALFILYFDPFMAHGMDNEQQDPQKLQKYDHLTQANIRDFLYIIQRWDDREKDKPITTILEDAKNSSDNSYTYYSNTEKIGTITKETVITHLENGKDIEIPYGRFTELMLGAGKPMTPMPINNCQPGSPAQVADGESCCCSQESCCCKGCCCTIS
jgi:hypothetical protein